MAISFVGNAENSGSATGVTSVTVPAPSGVADGDLMVAVIHGQTAATPPAQTGWTDILRTSGTAHYVGIYYRFRQSGDPASWSFTGLTSARVSSQTAAYRGVDTTTPLDGIAVTSTAGTTAISFPAITPATSGAWIVGVITVTQASTTSYTLSATNADATRATVLTPATSTTIDAGGAIIDEVWTSGAFTFTASSTSATTRTRGSRFALRPASSSAVTGVGTAAIGVSATAAGVPRTGGVGTSTLTVTATAAGRPRTFGQGTSTIAATATANGNARTLGQATATLTVTATASGRPRHLGQATASLTVTATAAGVIGDTPVTGVGTSAITVTATAAGIDRALGVGTATINLAATATGRPRTLGATVTTITVTATTAGTVRRFGTGTSALQLVAAAAGSGAGPFVPADTPLAATVSTPSAATTVTDRSTATTLTTERDATTLED